MKIYCDGVYRTAANIVNLGKLLMLFYCKNIKIDKIIIIDLKNFLRSEGMNYLLQWFHKDFMKH